MSTALDLRHPGEGCRLFDLVRGAIHAPRYVLLCEALAPVREDTRAGLADGRSHKAVKN